MSEGDADVAMESDHGALHPDATLQGRGDDLTAEKNGGIFKYVKSAGQGVEHPLSGDKVTVHYTGFFPDGKIFDSSRTRKEPFSFNVGKGEVIKAWDTAVPTMKKGEVSVITCLPDYAYGEKGSPPSIPPKAVLMFEIELLSWKGEDLSEEQDESVVRRVLEAGEGYKRPNDGSAVKVHLTGKCSGVVFEDRDVDFTLGDGIAEGIPDAIERALHKFKKGERSLLTLKPSKGYGAQGCPEKNIPPNAVLEYEVHLQDFEKCKESWEMEIDEKLEQAEIIKEKGTKFFKDQQWKLAKRNYKKIVDYLDSENNLEGDKMMRRDGLLLAAHLNLAMVHLKLQEHRKAVEECDAALQLDHKNEKAFFRRGQALVSLQEFDDAIADFKRCLEIAPDNKAAKNQILLTQQAMKKQQEAEKRRYAGMFQKFASIDAKKAQQEEYRNNDGKVFQNVSHWNNELAKDMMSLEEEAEAFGDTAPQPKFRKDFSQSNFSADEDSL